MNRRDALKGMTMVVGYAVSTPTLLNIFTACKAQDSWKPAFFSEEEAHMTKQLADIIIPKTELPSASELDVHKFVDLFINDVFEKEEKMVIKAGANAFQQIFQQKYDKPVKKGKSTEYEALLAQYFKISDEEKEQLWKDFAKLVSPDLGNEERNRLSIYSYLTSVRRLTLYGYYKSEKIGEEVLKYDPLPTTYDGCVDYEPGTKAWSLYWG